MTRPRSFPIGSRHLRGPARRLATVLATTALAAVPAGAGLVLSVDDTADAVDAAPGDGVCAAASGACSLRAALMEANATAASDVNLVPFPPFEPREVVTGLIGLRLDPLFAAALSASGIEIGAIAPTQSTKEGYRSPLVGGYMSPGWANLSHSGGLAFQGKRRSVVFTGWSATITGDEGRLVARVSGEPSRRKSGRPVGLFELDQASWQGGQGGAHATLTKRAAGLLNGLGRGSFEPGMPVGVLGIDSAFAKPPEGEPPPQDPVDPPPGSSTGDDR